VGWLGFGWDVVLSEDMDNLLLFIINGYLKLHKIYINRFFIVIHVGGNMDYVIFHMVFMSFCVFGCHSDVSLFLCNN